MLTEWSFKLYKNQIKDVSPIFHQMKLKMFFAQQLWSNVASIPWELNFCLTILLILIHHMTLSAD